MPETRLMFSNYFIIHRAKPPLLLSTTMWALLALEQKLVRSFYLVQWTGFLFKSSGCGGVVPAPFAFLPVYLSCWEWIWAWFRGPFPDYSVFAWLKDSSKKRETCRYVAACSRKIFRMEDAKMDRKFLGSKCVLETLIRIEKDQIIIKPVRTNEHLTGDSIE